MPIYDYNMSINQLQKLIPELTTLLQNIKQTNTIEQTNKVYNLIQHSDIKGLYICDNIITEQEETDLINLIKLQTWSTELTRRVQHYGYKYNYQKRKIDKNDHIGNLPEWTQNLQNRILHLIKDLIPYQNFDQLIINEYKRSQGISPHIDCVPCFIDGIVTVTIGCSGIMTFSNKFTGIKHDVKLEKRSFALLTKDARFIWTHEIDKAKNHNFTSTDPRISLTFRKCIL
jgi:alkylated DNA repair dioxygenase AlkB